MVPVDAGGSDPGSESEAERHVQVRFGPEKVTEYVNTCHQYVVSVVDQY